MSNRRGKPLLNLNSSCIQATKTAPITPSGNKAGTFLNISNIFGKKIESMDIGKENIDMDEPHPKIIFAPRPKSSEGIHRKPIHPHSVKSKPFHQSPPHKQPGVNLLQRYHNLVNLNQGPKSPLNKTEIKKKYKIPSKSFTKKTPNETHEKQQLYQKLFQLNKIQPVEKIVRDSVRQHSQEKHLKKQQEERLQEIKKQVRMNIKLKDAQIREMNAAKLKKSFMRRNSLKIDSEIKVKAPLFTAQATPMTESDRRARLGLVFVDLMKPIMQKIKKEAYKTNNLKSPLKEVKQKEAIRKPKTKIPRCNVKIDIKKKPKETVQKNVPQTDEHVLNLIKKSLKKEITRPSKDPSLQYQMKQLSERYFLLMANHIPKKEDLPENSPPAIQSNKKIEAKNEDEPCPSKIVTENIGIQTIEVEEPAQNNQLEKVHIDIQTDQKVIHENTCEANIDILPISHEPMLKTSLSVPKIKPTVKLRAINTFILKDIERLKFQFFNNIKVQHQKYY